MRVKGLYLFQSLFPSPMFFSLASSLFTVSPPPPPSLNLSSLLSHSLAHPHPISPLSSGPVSPHRVSAQTPLSQPLEVNDVNAAAVWLCHGLDAHRRSHLLTSLSLGRRQPGLMLVWPCQLSGVRGCVWVCEGVHVCWYLCIQHSRFVFVCVCVCVDVPLCCDVCARVHVLLLVIGVQFTAVAFSEALPERPRQ